MRPALLESLSRVTIAKGYKSTSFTNAVCFALGPAFMYIRWLPYFKELSKIPVRTATIGLIVALINVQQTVLSHGSQNALLELYRHGCRHNKYNASAYRN